MIDDLNSILNRLESRLGIVEQGTTVGTAGDADIGYDEATGVTTVNDQLDWTVTPTGWEPFSTVNPIVLDPEDVIEPDPDWEWDPDPDGVEPGVEPPVVDEEYASAGLSTPYARPEAHLIGQQCVLTGMVRRKTGATPNPLAANTRYNLPMFGLPADWRPMTNVILPCVIGNGDPTSSGGTGTAMIEIRPEFDPVQPSGRAYYVSGTVALSPTTGWIFLQGTFPIQIWDASEDAWTEDSWDDSHFQTTWDDVMDDVTWDNYTTLDN